MNGPIFIVSDNHFSMSDSINEQKRRKKLFNVFNKIKKYKNSTLIIGGDFFDYWFEYDEVIPSGYESLIEQLKILIDEGISIHYILGNHDFWDFGYLKKHIGITTHNGDLILKLSEKNIYITHGDGILKNDYGYRFMKKIIRSKLFIRLYTLFNSDFTTKFANKISNTSSRYNHNDKNVQMIKKDVLDFAKKKWSENYDMVLVGHYHQVGTINENNKSLTFLGDWLSKYTVTMISEKGLWQGNSKEFLNLF